MEVKYWKAVIRYGHVGYRNEVSVARYLKFPANTNVVDIMNEIDNMPGTKKRCIVSLASISENEYLTGKGQELYDFYLQNLFKESTA